MPQPIPIDPQQPYVIQTGKVGWITLFGGICGVVMGLAGILQTQHGAEPLVFALVLALFLAGLGIVAWFLSSRLRPPSRALTLSPDGLFVHIGREGLVPWQDVLGAREIQGTRREPPRLEITLRPGVRNTVLMRKYFKRLMLFRWIDRRFSPDIVWLPKQLLSVTIAQAIELLEIYHTAHAGPWATPD